MNNQAILSLKHYALTIIEAWIAFCIATFAIGMYFSHFENDTWTIFFAVIMVISYLFVIIVCIKRIVERLPIAALMLLIPIAPLAVLLLVISLLPIIQKLRYIA
jgi:hypothetical protein